ncbi:MAG: CSLREA domain-containing protein [Myxococcales bacterium]|nr:CSLREA domain-containing protein [Myxococcales bacterium]
MKLPPLIHGPFATRLLTVFVLVWCLPLDLAAQTSVAVNTTNDLDDGTCDATHCSLREAITASNNAVDGGIIAFNIPGSGPHTLQPSMALPPVEDGVSIDGTTQPGFAGAPVIELDGSLVGEAHGLDVVGSNNLIRALVINRFAGNGISISTDCTDNVIEGNYIGVDATGTAALGNGEAGVAMFQGASDTTIGGSDAGAGNVLSGNVFGVLIADGSVSGTQILGNLIGTNAGGDQAIPNSQTGILLWGTDTVIGGVEAGARNVISGNGFAGIDLGPGSTGTIIQGNYIGIDAAGTAALGNDLGIFVNFSPNNVIGGTESGAGNVVSGNVGLNININGLDASENILQGNYIGTDATGTVALPTGRALRIEYARNNLIGGTQPGARNVISGNYRGISIEGPTATENVIAGNYIGVDVMGFAPLGNRGAGIRFTTEASNNTVGGTEPGAGNIIANSTWVGIAVFPEAGTGNRILGNAIFDNAQLGIELNRDGVTPNDENDPDTGPNNLQNFPTLIAAVASGSGAVIEAELASAPDSSFLVDFFSNLACDEEGHGEGRTPLGSVTLSTDATGMGSVVAAFSTISGTILTATATDSDGSTSEFSQCLELATWGVSSSPTSRTVTPGESASYAISVSADGGTFDETVSLSCSGAPPEATCTFGQDEITLVDGQASATMTVSTAAPAGSSRVIPWTHGNPPWIWLSVALLLLVAMGLRERLRRSDPRWSPGLVPVSALRGAAIAALLGLLAVSQNSCGADGTPPPEGGTPTGTYELTITAAWESAQSTATATLVVQ